MPLDPASQRRLTILDYLQSSGGSRTDKEWQQFDSGKVHLDLDMMDLVNGGYVLHSNGKYTFTPTGKTELTRLKEASNLTSN